MNLIQSYWSKPAKIVTRTENSRHMGGWLSEKFHALSWTLSCLQLKRFYGKVTLYTDKDGKDWLINECNLPYDEVKEDLNCLDDFSPSLWALPKIYAYSQQTEPFIHADGDVYIWRAFSDELLNAPVFVQNFETEGCTSRVLEKMAEHFAYIPACLKGLADHKCVPSINAGIIGGTNASFFSLYANEAIKFLNVNTEYHHHIDLGVFNIVYEQILLYHLAKEQDIPISPCFGDVGKSYAYVLKFNLVPHRSAYIHMIGYAKVNPVACRQMEAHLKYLYPKYHRHICSLYPDKKTYSIADPSLGDLTLSAKALQLLRQNISNSPKDSPDKISIMGTPGCKIGEEVENIIQEYFDDQNSHLLSDVYQLEKGFCELETPVSGAEVMRDKMHLLYHTPASQFLRLSFQLNEKYCRILYLYYSWPLVPSPDKIDQVLKDEMSLKKSSHPLPYLLTRMNNEFLLEKIVGWRNVFCLLDDTRTGYELIEQLKEDKQTVYQGEDIKNDLYDFLTFQIFAKDTIEVITNNTCSIMCESEDDAQSIAVSAT